MKILITLLIVTVILLAAGLAYILPILAKDAMDFSEKEF